MQAQQGGWAARGGALRWLSEGTWAQQGGRARVRVLGHWGGLKEHPRAR